MFVGDRVGVVVAIGIVTFIGDGVGTGDCADVGGGGGVVDEFGANVGVAVRIWFGALVVTSVGTDVGVNVVDEFGVAVGVAVRI